MPEALSSVRRDERSRLREIVRLHIEANREELRNHRCVDPTERCRECGGYLAGALDYIEGALETAEGIMEAIEE